MSLSESRSVTKRIVLRSAARYLPGVVDINLEVGVGDVVQPLRSSFDRIGMVMATGVDADEAERHCQDAMAAIEITTE